MRDLSSATDTKAIYKERRMSELEPHIHSKFQWAVVLHYSVCVANASLEASQSFAGLLLWAEICCDSAALSRRSENNLLSFIPVSIKQKNSPPCGVKCNSSGNSKVCLPGHTRAETDRIARER